MYCPNCGKLAHEGQNFCKQCGTNLLVVSRALTGKLSAVDMSPRARKARAELSRGIHRGCWGLGLLALSVFAESFVLAAIGFFLLISGARRVASALPEPANQDAREALGRTLRRFYHPEHWRRSRVETPPNMDPPSRPTTPPPSVTEHTTVRLQEPDSFSAQIRPERQKH